MENRRATTSDLLANWRDATRAAEMADRLAELAAAAAVESDQTAAEAIEMARMAEEAAVASERAAERARGAAKRAIEIAAHHRQDSVQDDDVKASAHASEDQARHEYRDAEDRVRDKYSRR